jgi:hypothetical protein
MKMGQISIDELKEFAANARETIWATAKRHGKEPKIYLHWTAGHYNNLSDHYHVCINGDGEIFLMNPLDLTTEGTWKRNSGAVNLTICGCFDATTNHGLGSEPPTDKQIEVLSQCIAAIADGLWLTIDKGHVMTHGEAADNEDGLYCHEEYGPRTTCERWDLEYLGTDESPSFNPWAEDGTRGGDVLRGKANWYRNEWKKA